MPGYTQEGRRQALSISRLLQASRYMLAVGPPRSEMTPVKPGTLSRTSPISRSTESSETLDDAALVLGDGAEGAAAEAAALDRDREADHLVRGNVRLAVARVRGSAVGALVHPVHLLGGERNGRRVQPHLGVAVALHQGARITRIGLQVQDA